MSSGGIVQIAVYGAQDLYLTGNPQITFFKIVYRRYTNFAIQSSRQEFIGDVDFGSDVKCVIDKQGDLMNKVYLDIDLPSVCIPRKEIRDPTIIQSMRDDYATWRNIYDLTCAYVKANTKLAKDLVLLLRTQNICQNEIDVFMCDARTVRQVYESAKALKDQLMAQSDPNLAHDISVTNVYLRYWNIRGADRREQMLAFLTNNFYKLLQEFYLTIYQTYNQYAQKAQQISNNCFKTNYEFAWVEQIGNSIIDEISLSIGPQVIDRQTGQWMILHNNVTQNEYQLQNYYKMIGNVPELTTPSDSPIRSYKLRIPLNFWFCKSTGLSLPLIALRYNDVIVDLRLRSFSDVAYLGGNEVGYVGLLEQLQAMYGIKLSDVCLYVDYIYLDRDERRRFAQSTHEYLIETVQYATFTDILGSKVNIRLNFTQPCKYVFFFFQPEYYRHNPGGFNKCQWNNFGTEPDKTGQTLYNTVLSLNTINITDTSQPIIYFNYAQPYMFFKRSPTDGQYTYSFALEPTEIQPSGSCNMSRIDNFNISCDFTMNFIEKVNQNPLEDLGVLTGGFAGVYVQTLNILRFMGGMGGLAYTSGS